MSQLRNNTSQRYSNNNVSSGFGRSGTSQHGGGRFGSGFVSLGGLPKVQTWIHDILKPSVYPYMQCMAYHMHCAGVWPFASFPVHVEKSNVSSFYNIIWRCAERPLWSWLFGGKVGYSQTSELTFAEKGKFPCQSRVVTSGMYVTWSLLLGKCWQRPSQPDSARWRRWVAKART